jgi:hypothetical protein
MMKKECRVVIYKEGLLGSLFFGEAKADPDKMSQFLSSYTREGWEVKTMSVERRRTALFWSREAYLFVLERPSDSLRLVYRLSQAFLSAAFRADGYSPAPACCCMPSSLAQTMPVVSMAKPKR